MLYGQLFDLLTLKRRRSLSHALLDNWWVDHPQRPGESVLSELHAAIDRHFHSNPAAEPDRAFRDVISAYTSTDG